VNGYDGFSGAHNNLMWSVGTGRIFYSLNNKLIEENTQNRSQKIWSDAETRISTLAYFSGDKTGKKWELIAAAEGDKNSKGYSDIFLYNVTQDTNSKSAKMSAAKLEPFH
jgi:hypothetical protein